MDASPELLDNIRRILIPRNQTGASIETIKEDYQKKFGKPLPFTDMVPFMLTIPSVMCLVADDKTLFFKVQNDESTKLLFEEFKHNELNKKSDTNTAQMEWDQCSIENANDSTSWNTNVNVIKKKWRTLSRVPEAQISDSLMDKSHLSDPCAAHFMEYLLLGDDFFLSLAKFDSKKGNNDDALVYGLCASGQTIADAIHNVKSISSLYKDMGIIVNIGSVDIMKKVPLEKIVEDYRILVDILLKKGFKIVLTTLAPLAYQMYEQEAKRSLMHLNKYIKTVGRFMRVVDIWSAMMNKNSQLQTAYYEQSAKQIRGTMETYVPWSDAGCQHVQQTLELALEL